MYDLEVSMLTWSQGLVWSMISRIVIEPCRAAWSTMRDGVGLTTERWYCAARTSCDESCLVGAYRCSNSTIKYSHQARAGRAS